MNLSERKSKIIELYYNQCKTYREIAKITHTSPKQIKKIIDDEKPKRLHNDILKMIFEGKTIKEITIELNLDSEQIEKAWKQYLRYNVMDSLFQIYSMIQGPTEEFAELCRYLSQKNLKTSYIQKLIQIDQKLDYHLNLRNRLVAEVHDLENTIASQKQQILDQKRTIQNNTDKINQLKNEEKKLEMKLITLKEDLTTTTTKINTMKSGKTYHDFQQFLKNINDDQQLYNLIYNLLKVIFNNLHPFALYNKDWIIHQIPNLAESYFEPIDNFNDLVESDMEIKLPERPPIKRRTIDIIIEKCKEMIMNLFLDQYSPRS